MAHFLPSFLVGDAVRMIVCDFHSANLQHAEIFRGSDDAMRSVMWHKDQKSVCALVLAIVNEAQTL